MKDKNWQQFEITGSIIDYLVYKGFAHENTVPSDEQSGDIVFKQSTDLYNNFRNTGRFEG